MNEAEKQTKKKSQYTDFLICTPRKVVSLIQRSLFQDGTEQTRVLNNEKLTEGNASETCVIKCLCFPNKSREIHIVKQITTR